MWPGTACLAGRPHDTGVRTRPNRSRRDRRLSDQNIIIRIHKENILLLFSIAVSTLRILTVRIQIDVKPG